MALLASHSLRSQSRCVAVPEIQIPGLAGERKTIAGQVGQMPTALMKAVSNVSSARAIDARLSGEAGARGQEAHALMERLYPLCRSLTGDGVRRTLELLQEVIPLKIHEVQTGTRVYDWTVPNEWNVKDAYVLDRQGRRVIDFCVNNLHLAGYSASIDATIDRSRLLEHLFSDPDHPDWIPYKHFYHKEGWGFCVSHRQLRELNEPEYRVRIDSRLEPGSLTYGEFIVPGRESSEVLVSTHTCHPSLCNDNLSGIVTAALLARDLAQARTGLGFRFVFVPATLGPLVWLSRNEHLVPHICGGLVIAGVGDPGPFTYIRSRRSSARIDRAIAHTFACATSVESAMREFVPVGYDQRQYCSPGFNLPMGCFMRTPHGEYPEYHTSADNLQFTTAAALGESWRVMRLALDILDEDRVFLNLSPKGEPRLGARGLFADAERLGLFWILNFSDGHHSLLDIAERARMPFWNLREGAQRLEECGLLAMANNNVIG
jgi:aminopeptidase-like protein